MVEQLNDNAKTWRDLAERIHPRNVDIFAAAEQRGVHPAELLDWARDSIKADAEQAEVDARLVHIAVPAGATAGKWDFGRVDDGDATRSLEWSTFSTATAYIAIDGLQHEDGAVTRGVSVHASHGDLSELTPADVRELASALVRAADELDGLE